MKKIITKALSVLTGPERSKLGRITLLQIFLSIADVGALALLLAVIHLYTLPETAPRPSWLPSFFYDTHFLLPIGLFLLLFTLKNIAGYFIVRAQYHYVYGVASRLSRQSMYQYLQGNYTDYVNVPLSVRIRQIGHQPIEFCNYVLYGIIQMSAEMLVTLIAVIAILIFNAQIFLLLLLLLVPPVVFAALLTRRKLRTSRQDVKHTSEKATQYLNEALDSYVESNLYHGQSFFADRYASFQKRLNDNLAGLQVVQAIPSRFIEVFAVLGLFILILVNRYSDHAAATDLINIGAFMAAAYKIIPGITRIANMGAQVRTYAYTMKDILQEQKAAPQPFNAIKVHIDTISFSDVSFSREHKNILQHFNTAIQQGDFIGLVSDSGKGKTTLVNLLLGFLEPEDGHISFNGLPATAAVRQQFWHDIAYVKQQNFLIHDTIARNIVLQEGPYNETKLAEVIQQTGLAPFVQSFAEGVDRIISDSGKDISGGQRQRIAIARALYKDARLIILDEPFNELDESSEVLLIKHFSDLAAKGHIVLLITHNTAGLSYCNKIITLHD